MTHEHRSDVPLVSVVLPVRNEARTIDACLRALCDQTLRADRFEVLVVDGDSDDTTRKQAEAWALRDPRVRVLTNPARITPAALNIGIRAARGEIIARMDGHAVAPPDYLERGLQVLQSTGAWAAGGQMKRVGYSATTDAIAIATMSPFGVGDSRHNYSDQPMWAETVFLGIWPRWVFERVGLFDEELVRNQDDELSFRIRQAGGRIRYDPRMVVEYAPRRSFSKLFDQYRQYAEWKVRVLQMHPTALRWRHFAPMTLLGSLVAGVVVGIKVPLIRRATAILAGTYLATVAAAATRLGGGRVGPSARILAALLTLHLAYGAGFWQGLIRFAPRWASRRRGRPGQMNTPDR